MQLLMNPAEYGLSKNIGVKGEQNLRLLSTVFIYALRQVYTKLQQRVAGSLVGECIIDNNNKKKKNVLKNLGLFQCVSYSASE